MKSPWPTLVVAALCLALLPVMQARADAVLDLNGILLETISAYHPAPPVASRQIAMLNAAMFDSANAAVGLRFTPYSYDGMPVAAAAPDLAARVAGAAVLRALFPDLTSVVPGLATRLAVMETMPKGAEAAIALGQACAAAILKARANDNANARPPPFLGDSAIGTWRSTSATPRPGLLPHWGSVTPWAIADLQRLVPPPPPSIGSTAWLDAFNAVKSLGTQTGASHTPEMTRIAEFWADGEGTETPPGHWIAIARALAVRRGGDVVDHAREFALLSFVLADVAIVAWETKYRYAGWRPVTAVHEAARIGNPRIIGDPAWRPTLDTPNFPEYPSGHSAFSAAAAAALAMLYPDPGDTIAFDTLTSSPKTPGAVRHFERLSEAAEEAGLSRIYGGIHFWFSHGAGADMGRAVADDIVPRLLRPRS